MTIKKSIPSSFLYYLILWTIITILPIFAHSTALADGENSGITNEVGNVALNTPLSVTPPKGESFAVGWLSSLEFWMSSSVLIFGLIIFSFEAFIIRCGGF